ncbi:hypothetical protein AX17_001412 [Amanita inopinata Kibby_2008]|nr:hypothetical protein AX17_001412 [Amanita inopinata Kibby_2008]
MHPRSNNNSRKTRITLPPIRDIFRDELSRSAHDSPSIRLAQLHVSDEDASMKNAARSRSPRPHMNEEADASIRHAVSHNQYASPYPKSYQQQYYSPPRSSMPPVISLSNSRSHMPDSSGGHQLHRHSVDGGTSSRHVDSMPQYINLTDTNSRPASNVAQAAHHSSHYSYPPYAACQPSYHARNERQPPGPSWPSTGPPLDRVVNDEERSHGTPHRRSQARLLASEDPSGRESAPAKYECRYCGKGFNRPSSLKIHLNSHTGEKPFVCPVESCGRSFSVLSNMRRHARVHTQNLLKDPEPSSDESSLNSSPMLVGIQHSHTTASPSGSTLANTSSRWHRRRNSNASVSSSSSRRSSSEEDNMKDARVEKQSRR